MGILITIVSSLLLLMGCSTDPVLDPKQDFASGYFVAGRIEANWAQDTVSAFVSVSNIIPLPDLALKESISFGVENAELSITCGDSTYALTMNEPGLYTADLVSEHGDRFFLNIITPDSVLLTSEAIRYDSLTFVHPKPGDTIDVWIDSVKSLEDVGEQTTSSHPTSLEFEMLPDGVEIFTDGGHNIYFPGLSSLPQLVTQIQGNLLVIDNQIKISVFSTSPKRIVSVIDGTTMIANVHPENVGAYFDREHNRYEGQSVLLTDLPTNIEGGYGHFYYVMTSGTSCTFLIRAHTIR